MLKIYVNTLLNACQTCGNEYKNSVSNDYCPHYLVIITDDNGCFPFVNYIFIRGAKNS